MVDRTFFFLYGSHQIGVMLSITTLHKPGLPPRARAVANFADGAFMRVFLGAALRRVVRFRGVLWSAASSESDCPLVLSVQEASC